jgi:hypothetical protein
MNRRSALLITTCLAVAGAVCLAFGLTATPPASAKLVENVTFHVEFDSQNDCAPEGPVLDFHDSLDVRSINVTRGDGGVTYGTGIFDLVAVTTIPGTDLTLTVINKGLGEHGVVAIDHGDGTYTVRSISTAIGRLLGPDGRMVSTFAGLYAFELLIDNAGTPETDADDVVLDMPSETLHGSFDDAGGCEVARSYLP